MLYLFNVCKNVRIKKLLFLNRNGLRVILYILNDNTHVCSVLIYTPAKTLLGNKIIVLNLEFSESHDTVLYKCVSTSYYHWLTITQECKVTSISY